MLISKRNGSYFFISELITDIELEYDKPFGGNYCGDCSLCMDNCPTHAITDLRTIDANKCISYLTIENKGEIPSTFQGKYKNWIFGCDICQQVCPWNRFSTPHQEPAFEPSSELLSFQKCTAFCITPSRPFSDFEKGKRQSFDSYNYSASFIKLIAVKIVNSRL